MKSFLSSALAIVILFSAAACGRRQTAAEAEGVSEGPVVYASIYPLYDFASQIAGERATVKCLVTGGGEAHDWEPTAGDIVALENADIFIYNGAELEHWVDTVLGALGNDNLIVVEAAAAVELLEVDGYGAHDYDGHDEGEHGHSHGTADPHTWLSPANAKLQSTLILQALVDVDPGNEAYYRERFEAYAGALDALDEMYREALAPYKGSEIVVAHAAFGYLCGEYGLEQMAVQGFSPDSEPNPSQMAGAIEYAGEHDIKVIFFEEAASPAVAEAIAREIGAETGMLDPLEQMSDERINRGETYLTVMEQNLEALLTALA